MVVEVVGASADESRFQRVLRRLAFVVGLLTVGMIIFWAHDHAHRSVLNFVVTCLWALASIVLVSMSVAGPDAKIEGEDGR